MEKPSRIIGENPNQSIPKTLNLRTRRARNNPGFGEILEKIKTHKLEAKKGAPLKITKNLGRNWGLNNPKIPKKIGNLFEPG